MGSGPYFLKRQGQGQRQENKLDLIRILPILRIRISKKQSSKVVNLAKNPRCFSIIR